MVDQVEERNLYYLQMSSFVLDLLFNLNYNGKYILREKNFLSVSYHF